MAGTGPEGAAAVVTCGKPAASGAGIGAVATKVPASRHMAAPPAPDAQALNAADGGAALKQVSLLVLELLRDHPELQVRLAKPVRPRRVHHWLCTPGEPRDARARARLPARRYRA